MKIKIQYQVRPFLGSYIILPVGEDVWKDPALLLVNELGLDILRLLSSDTDETEILRWVLEAYDIDEATAKRDIRGYVAQLQARDMLSDADQLED